MGAEHELSDAGILIVDDSPANVALLEVILEQHGYRNVRSTTSSHLALPLFTQAQPDLVLLDLRMPPPDGFTLMEEMLQRAGPDTYLPILVITGDLTQEVKERALARGAKDFLTKPYEPTEVALRIRNLLETRRLHLTLKRTNEWLEAKVRERTLALELAQIETIERLALAAEYRDDQTGQHARRVGRTAERLARALGLGEGRAAIIGVAAQLHDIGKIGIPDSILLKPGPLTPDEMELMKLHTTIGARILSGSSSPLLITAETIALTHHERWDGLGYPRGLRGEEIPVEGRIVAVADAFDALTAPRPHRAPPGPREAWDALLGGAGRQWDPRIVETLARVLEEEGT